MTQLELDGLRSVPSGRNQDQGMSHGTVCDTVGRDTRKAFHDVHNSWAESTLCEMNGSFTSAWMCALP